MELPDIEKESIIDCPGCGIAVLPLLVVCEKCKSVIRTNQRSTWSSYSAKTKRYSTKVVEEKTGSKDLSCMEEENISLLISPNPRRFGLLGLIRKLIAIFFLIVLIVGMVSIACMGLWS